MLAFVIGISITVTKLIFEPTPPVIVTTGAEGAGSSSFNTTNPLLISGSSSSIILGTVLSNETANIYPRREGIVEDIYVDIGDSVEKNQVVALLLSKGVEGQSAAAISEKNARKAQAEADYLSAQAVAEETIINTRQKIREKETELFIAQREQEALLDKFAEYETNIVQMRDQAFTAVRNARQVIEQILIGSNSRAGAAIDEDDLFDQLGLLSPETRYDVFPLFNELYSQEQNYSPANKNSINALLSIADKTLTSSVSLLGATPSVSVTQPGLFTQQELANLTSRILSSQTNILKAKDKLEDAENVYEKLISAEPELYQAHLTGDSSAAQSNKVALLTEKIQTAENSLHLTEANQQQIIERQKSMVNVAAAMLQSEVAKSGHREVRSPFSGTVSKRFLEVGQIVMPSMTAFELTDVPTTLAKSAKREIKFGLPEHLQSAVTVGDTVSFSLPDKEELIHSAEVTRVSPQIDMQTHTVTVQAKLDDELKLPHNTSVRIRVTDQSLPIFQVPSFSVKRDENQNVIWILNSESKEPQQVTVTVISEDGEFAEISGDISELTQVILDPPGFIAMPTHD